jgi:phosphonoacetate hydrolase
MTDDLGAALDVLLHPSLEPIVELVVHRDGDDYVAAAVDGRSTFDRDGRVLRVEGRDPLADQSADRFAGVDQELANRHPHRTTNAYPYAREQVVQLFDHPSPPDICVIHTAAHNWEDQGGHRGEHGSLDVVQARAPFILAGRGVRAQGMVDRACRLVDVAPTVAELMGVAPLDDGRLLAVQDGEPMSDLLDPSERPDHVVGFLFDGCNPNVLYEAAANGDAPNVARLMAMGTTFRHGAMASLPSVTLANHTSVLTGAHPGHHGILHNAWYDRASGQQVITNSPAHWATAMGWLAPGVETLHHAVHRTWPGDVSASVNEPSDAGADYSTFSILKAGIALERPPATDELPHATDRFVRPVKEYRWSSLVDHTTVQQTQGIWGDGPYLGTDWARPRFTWCNFSLTDAAFHEGGPHSEIAQASIHDTDARLGEILDTVERSGAWDRTAFFLVADHGMEETHPEVTGDWGPALHEAGVPFRDEAFGFLYLGTFT